MMAAAIYFLMSDSEKTKYFNWFQGHTTDSTAIISVYDFGKKCSKSDFKFHSLNCDSVESTYLGNQLYINKIYLKWSSRNDVKIEYKNSQNEMHSLTLKLSKDSLKIIVGSCIYQFQGLKKIWMPGNGWDIFKAMLQEDADMMLWLGDNVYYRNKDFKSKEAKAIKNLYVRNMIAQDFFKSTLHYSIWDDHDYGENNAGNANPQL
jgi:hypothetical protein